MSDVSSVEGSQYFISSLQEYVCKPLSTATHLINQERTEVKAERDAFKEFFERLAALDPVTTPINRHTAKIHSQTTSGKFDYIRTAYRETVMSTSHHEELYTDQLNEDLADEFGLKIAAGIHQSSSTRFTPAFKKALETETKTAINVRNEFLDTLGGEAESIETSRNGIIQATSTLDTTVIPEWHYESFAEQLNRIGEERQQTIQTRDYGRHLGEFSLCAYLYSEQPWKYPVLTGLARLRETTTLESDPDTNTNISSILD